VVEKKDSVVADRLNVSKDLRQQIKLSELRRVYILTVREDSLSPLFG
jgi:hypothetical protein